MAKVILNNIKKIYDKDIVAVQEFNLEISDKEFIVLVGPSGCGKSTTLRMVAGLEEISSGELFIGDKLVNDIPPKDRDIAMVFQNYALYPHMTVYNNMAFSLKLRKVKKSEIDRRVKEAANILGITDLLSRRPKALSGGQRQRVAIGRAILREPKVFLMDEPLSNLDAKLRDQMRTEIIKLHQRINTTFIYVTHDQIEAMTLGDRIVIMKDGIIQQIGTPQEVFDQPINLFVAGFIGTPRMNFLDAKLENVNGEYFVTVDEKRIPLPKEIQKALSDKGEKARELKLGIRPEHMRIASQGTRNGIRATVNVSETLGSEVYLHVTLCGEDAIIRVPTLELPSEQHKKITMGTDLDFQIDGRLIHMFDKETSLNIFA